MEYVRIASSDRVVTDITSTLSDHLERNETVVWLLSGGSALPIEVEVARRLAHRDTKNLRITFTDERYGEPGHADENYTQLMNLGFSLPHAEFYRILDGGDRASTATKYARRLEDWFASSDYRFGILGIGPDGHTAGIKPYSPAVNSGAPAVLYEWDDYTRLTMTASMIARLDETAVYATGENKRATLRQLLHTAAPANDQPAQMLKMVKKSTLYTDITL